jgi:acyl carrier protein phosphodiesterase
MSTAQHRRLDRLEANCSISKRAAEMTDAELCRIAGVPLDVSDEDLQRIADGTAQKEPTP